MGITKYSELEYEIVEVGKAGHGRGVGRVFSTRSLGSGLGMSIYDPRIHLGFLMHVPLPRSSIDEELAATNPYMFVDTAVPALFDAFFKAGGRRHRMQVKVAGCAVPAVSDRAYWIGERNVRIAVSICGKNDIRVDANAVGGFQSRRMRLRLDIGRVVLSNGIREWIL